MPVDCISYQKSGYFSEIINDYLDQNPEIEELYNQYPTIENFKTQIDQKKTEFTAAQREVLVEALTRQNQTITLSQQTQNNIRQLKDSNTFTITTGHQLSLFTGPLYFLYKIVSVINLAKQLSQTYPTSTFVPVFWMATEDHDFEEISSFKVKDKKIQWSQDQKGAVGKIDTSTITAIEQAVETVLGQGKNAEFLKEIFENAYLKHTNLADATRYLVNQLFADKGLLIIDGDDKALKKQVIPAFTSELKNKTAYKAINQTLANFSYPVQVTPREINLFFLQENSRERIVFEDERFQVLNTNLNFSEQEIIALLTKNPEKFSPNVVLRPLYQETILPNLAYIGGGGEIAYWLELKNMFKQFNVAFPMLMLRDSVLVLSPKQRQKLEKLHLSVEELFLKQTDLITKKTIEFSQISLSLEAYKTQLKTQFNELKQLISKTDSSFEGAVLAQEKKQLNGLDALEKRLLKAQKRKYKEQLDKIIEIQNQVFPNQGLQERQLNFSEFYLEYGSQFLEDLYKKLDPLQIRFKVI